MPTVLVTGGAGYIGSHTTFVLLEAGWDVVVFDNLSNSSPVALRRVAELAGRVPAFVEGDIRDADAMRSAFASHPVDAVVHFAGLKAVGESVRKPLRYYDNNVTGTQVLLRAMQDADVRRLVFSSSCTVYGEPDQVPINEDAPLKAPESPYGQTKAVIERMLRDLSDSEPGWGIVALRYFNPVGAHPSGRIGEDPLDEPNNLMPLITQLAVGRRSSITVFGDDYPTRDGTCIRDYVHVSDLADAHRAALDTLPSRDGFRAINVGTGVGTTVLELIAAASVAAGTPLAYEVGARRSGDTTAVWADSTIANRDLDWRATKTVDEMCTDHLRWQQQNPNGYRNE